MIRHVVLVRFGAQADAAERDAVFAELAALRDAVPGVLSFAGGKNVSAEGRTAGFTHGFTMDFADPAARDAYLEHPVHVRAGERLLRAADGDDGVLVVDLVFED
ncbi:MAG: Dabb family protein [Gluconacetobacter diazotrophicus]|nr:Dabb family protein [Gluconacetobacter diazotrophicus]